MENVKNIIKNNLIRFRKERKLTQSELAEKIAYSDKAVSRWETGEVTPDIETLNNLSEIYDIPLTAFFDENYNIPKHSHRISMPQIGNKVAISGLAILCVWFISTILFVYEKIYFDKNNWMLFVWGVPVSAIVGLVFNCIWGRRYRTFVIISILVWTSLASIYLQFLPYNIYLIFILGIPMQVGIILWSCLKSHKGDYSNIDQ